MYAYITYKIAYSLHMHAHSQQRCADTMEMLMILVVQIGIHFFSFEGIFHKSFWYIGSVSN